MKKRLKTPHMVPQKAVEKFTDYKIITPIGRLVTKTPKNASDHLLVSAKNPTAN